MLILIGWENKKQTWMNHLLILYNSVNGISWVSLENIQRNLSAQFSMVPTYAEACWSRVLPLTWRRSLHSISTSALNQNFRKRIPPESLSSPPGSSKDAVVACFYISFYHCRVLFLLLSVGQGLGKTIWGEDRNQCHMSVFSAMLWVDN